LHVTTHLGAPVFTQANWLSRELFTDFPEQGTIVCRIPKLPLPMGHYHLGFTLKAAVKSKELIDHLESAHELNVEAGDYFGTGKLPPIQAGVCLVEGWWELRGDECGGTIRPVQ
jgi:hypothetical protein